MNEEKTGLDYVSLWKTLMRTGIKQRFSQIRSEFFMKIATDGVRKFKGEEAIEDIIADSEIFKNSPSLVEYFKKAIGSEDEFKHYEYHTDDGLFHVEYFANLTSEISPEFAEYCLDTDDIGVDYDVDGYCASNSYKVNLQKEDDDGEMHDVAESRSSHIIIIWEASPSINPDTYPSIIKHELSHACLFETRMQLEDEMEKSMRVPAAWTDEDIEQWHKDVDALREVLSSKDRDAVMFREFVADFLMYESDGQTKEKNPIQESRVPKATSPNAKSKVTYRTQTPIDRFEDHLEELSDEYQIEFQKIVNELRAEYEEYDKFLDEIKMM